MLDELSAEPMPSKKRPAAKAARKRRVASPAELAKSPRPRHALPGPLPNVVAPAERPAMLQRIDEVRRSLAAGAGADGGEALLNLGGALLLWSPARVVSCLTSSMLVRCGPSYKAAEHSCGVYSSATMSTSDKHCRHLLATLQQQPGNVTMVALRGY